MNPTWKEYDAAAQWCAERGYSGEIGSPLPPLLSTRCKRRIDYDTEAFARHVRATAYALAMDEMEDVQ